MMKLTKAALLAAVPLAATLATAAHAGAFYLQEQSIRAAGRAFSGIGADQGADALWWNPAAIGSMTGGEAYGGFSAIMPKGDVVNVNTLIVRPGQAPAPVGGEQVSKDPLNKGYLPSGAFAYAITPELAVGVAITSPFSFTSNYKTASWARYTADKSKLRTFDVQPSIAWAPTPNISVGAGLNVEYAYASLSNSLPNLSPLLADGHQTLEGDGVDVGFSVGGQYRSGPLMLGLSYKSSIKHKLGGRVTVAGLLGPLAPQNRQVEASATFRTPWQLIGSARFKASEALTLNAQVVRLGWNEFDSIRLGAPLNVALPQNYKNSWSYAAGVDYAVGPALTVRGGVQRDLTPTRDGDRDARVPDASRWNYALGASYKLSDSITLDAAANYIDVSNSSIDRVTAAYAGTPVQTPILVNGRLRKASVVVLGLGGRLTF